MEGPGEVGRHQPCPGALQSSAQAVFCHNTLGVRVIPFSCLPTLWGPKRNSVLDRLVLELVLVDAGCRHSGNLRPCPGKSHKARRSLHARGPAGVYSNWRSSGPQEGSEGPAVGPVVTAGTHTQYCSTWKLCGVGVANRSRAEQSLERLHRKTTWVSLSLQLHGPELDPTKGSNLKTQQVTAPQPKNEQIQSRSGSVWEH